MRKPKCPLYPTFELLSRKWVLYIIKELTYGGRRRYSELKRSLEGVSPKTLTERLRELVRARTGPSGVISEVATKPFLIIISSLLFFTIQTWLSTKRSQPKEISHALLRAPPELA